MYWNERKKEENVLSEAKQSKAKRNYCCVRVRPGKTLPWFFPVSHGRRTRFLQSKGKPSWHKTFPRTHCNGLKRPVNRRGGKGDGMIKEGSTGLPNREAEVRQLCGSEARTRSEHAHLSRLFLRFAKVFLRFSSFALSKFQIKVKRCRC